MKSKINTALLALFFAVLVCFSVSNRASAQVEKEKNANVEMYYFHFNTRCETCRAVESEAKLGVQLLFGDEVKFASVNLDEKSGEAKGKELGVNSQMLLIVKGKKKINLTNEGFLYAQTNPDKFRKIIEEKIKPLL
jgi:hypothetical protein